MGARCCSAWMVCLPRNSNHMHAFPSLPWLYPKLNGSLTRTNVKGEEEKWSSLACKEILVELLVFILKCCSFCLGKVEDMILSLSRDEVEMWDFMCIKCKDRNMKGRWQPSVWYSRYVSYISTHWLDAVCTLTMIILKKQLETVQLKGVVTLLWMKHELWNTMEGGGECFRLTCMRIEGFLL